MAKRELPIEEVEGEIAIIIDYKVGESEAISVLNGAMSIIEALDEIDKSLLSSVNTSLNPVSILNDIQHSSLKILLKRALKNIPDEEIENLEYRKWIGRLLVRGKHKLLQIIEYEDDEIENALKSLAPEYDRQPNQTTGYDLPDSKVVKRSLNKMRKACASLNDCEVTIQSEDGDIKIPKIDYKEEFDSDMIINQSKQENFLLVIETIAFEKTAGWRFSDGDSSFNASLEDEAFLTRIEQGEPFKRGDRLKVNMIVEQTQKEKNIITKRKIVKVLEHISE